MITNRPWIITYLKVGYLLHLVTLVEISALLMLFNFLKADEWIANDPSVWKWIALLYFASLPVFPNLDAWSRHQNYKQLKDKLYVHGFQPRLLQPYLKSRCQRDAAYVAAEELGMGTICKKLYQSKGYRWYHLLPDTMVSNPQYLFHPLFWKTTFFVPYYKPKVNFRSVFEEKSLQAAILTPPIGI